MRHRSGRARAAWLLTVPTAAVLLGGLAVMGSVPAHAGPQARPGGWQSYREQPRNSDVKAVSATVLSGSVSNVRGLTSDGHGDTTLTVTSVSHPATVLLDYGVEVEGTPYLNAESHSGTAPAVSLAFTEAKTYLRTPGSSAPGGITGNSAFQPRRVSLTVIANGTLSSGLMGGFRFEAITLTTPGTVVLRGAGLQFGDGSLRWAEGAVPTPYGRIFVRWTRGSHRFSLTVAVPAQTTAFIELPDGPYVTLAGSPRGTERTFAG